METLPIELLSIVLEFTGYHEITRMVCKQWYDINNDIIWTGEIAEYQAIIDNYPNLLSWILSQFDHGKKTGYISTGGNLICAMACCDRVEMFDIVYKSGFEIEIGEFWGWDINESNRDTIIKIMFQDGLITIEDIEMFDDYHKTSYTQKIKNREFW